MAHLGYLHCLRTFSRCCNSLFNNSSVEHMVLALCVRMLIYYSTGNIGHYGWAFNIPLW